MRSARLSSGVYVALFVGLVLFAAPAVSQTDIDKIRAARDASKRAEKVYENCLRQHAPRPNSEVSDAEWERTFALSLKACVSERVKFRQVTLERWPGPKGAADTEWHVAATEKLVSGEQRAYFDFVDCPHGCRPH